jgi:hypothetical protein
MLQSVPFTVYSLREVLSDIPIRTRQRPYSNMATKKQAVIGSSSNFWLHTPKSGFDLTHPATPDAASIYPRLSLDTTTAKVTIDPAKTALVLVDFQNFFLSPVLGRPKGSKGIIACEQVAKFAIELGPHR